MQQSPSQVINLILRDQPRHADRSDDRNRLACAISYGIITSDPGFNQMIHIDEIWLFTQPMDMRAGTDTESIWLRVKPHSAYLFCNKRGHRMKGWYMMD